MLKNQFWWALILVNCYIRSSTNFKSCFNLINRSYPFKRRGVLKSILVSFKLNSAAANIITFIIAYLFLNALVFSFSILLIYLILKLEEDKLQLLQTPTTIFKIGSKNLNPKNTGIYRKLPRKIPRQKSLRDLLWKIPVI